jgi:hydrocephalus-inducing protein
LPAGQDGKYAKKQFRIEPATGEVLPGGQVDVKVHLVATVVQDYDMYLAVDVLDVGDTLRTIAIKATCVVADVKMMLSTVRYSVSIGLYLMGVLVALHPSLVVFRCASQINFGECFLKYPYTQNIVISNTSDHPARYEILPQDEHSAVIAEFSAEMPRGSIEPRSDLSVPITLIGDRLGKVNIPLLVRVSGTEQPPMKATIEVRVITMSALTVLLLVHVCARTGYGVGLAPWLAYVSIGFCHFAVCCLPSAVVSQASIVGPRVEAGASEVHFGKVGCLTDVTRTLTLKNVSLIPAPFKTFIKTTRSKFRVDILEGVLAPDEMVTLTLTCNLDDALPHKDELHVVVTDGDNLSVTLKAIGTGTTLYCDHDVSTVDFGHVFTTSVCEHTFVMENKGRRVQSIQWINATLKELEAEERRKVRFRVGRVHPHPPTPPYSRRILCNVARLIGLGCPLLLRLCPHPHQRRRRRRRHVLVLLVSSEQEEGRGEAWWTTIPWPEDGACSSHRRVHRGAGDRDVEAPHRVCVHLPWLLRQGRRGVGDAGV